MKFLILELMMISFLNYSGLGQMHSYSDNDADATLTSDDEHVKFEAHKGINMDTLAYAVEPSAIIDINLASMDEFAELKAHKVISRLAALS